MLNLWRLVDEEHDSVKTFTEPDRLLDADDVSYMIRAVKYGE